ncbi:MAG: hypothetical protein IKC03_06480, partial [Oscillospiraceae bacterium]|nr:hypothetical protein [Oscillospiraceae bacterium]
TTRFHPARGEKKSICISMSHYDPTQRRKINGRWYYLMPGDSERTVQLCGKMQHYGMERLYGEEDLSVVRSLLNSNLVPAEILYSMLAFTFLSPLNHFFKLAGHEPKFVLFLVGRTGSRKSTLAALFLSFFGRFTGAELPLSFRDTANSILHHAFALKDTLTCIDDFHPSARYEEKKLTDTAQTIMRAYGDRTGRGRLRPDASPQESRPPQGNAIITGEFPPDIGESGTARYFSLELHEGDVNLDSLSEFQKLAADGVLQRCMFGFVEWVRETWLHDLKHFTAVLKKNFEHHRDVFQKEHPTCHGRVLEAAAWLEIGMQMLLSFLCDTSQLDRSASNLHEKAFHDLLLKMIERQTVSILEDKPTHKFLQNLYALIQSGQVCLLSKDVTHNDIPENCIGYEDDSMYYLFNETTYKTVRKFCKEQGVSFTISPKALLKQLAEEGFLDGGSKQHTKSLRFNHQNKRVACLFRDKIEQLLSIPPEKESDSLSAQESDRSTQ